MKKDEIEALHDKYHELMSVATIAESNRQYREAIQAAISAWDYIEALIQYEQKFEKKDFVTISAIDLVIKYAPLLLDLNSLRKLENLLKNHRRIGKATYSDKNVELIDALWQIKKNHRLWSHLENSEQVLEDGLGKDLGGEQSYWQAVAETWGKMGLVKRILQGKAYVLDLTTRLGQIVSGRCPGCGIIRDASKSVLLNKITCSKCGSTVHFIILTTKV